MTHVCVVVVVADKKTLGGPGRWRYSCCANSLAFPSYVSFFFIIIIISTCMEASSFVTLSCCLTPLLDPMNALTNLTGAAGGPPGTIGMGPRPPGVPVGMGPMQIGQHAMAGVAGNPQASECVSFQRCVCA